MVKVLLLAVLVGGASAFAPLATPSSTQCLSTSTVLNAYIPDGLSKDEWAKIKKRDAVKAKNLGRMGPRGFKSRSFQSFQEALERGETTHLLPVFNAEEKVKKGIIKREDIPYMQRGGSWDNSDVKGARKAKWLQSDKQYAEGGFKKEQSVSIFGYGGGLDWTGTKDRGGPDSIKTKPVPMGRNYKAPNVKDLTDSPKKKGPFGLW